MIALYNNSRKSGMTFANELREFHKGWRGPSSTPLQPGLPLSFELFSIIRSSLRSDVLVVLFLIKHSFSSPVFPLQLRRVSQNDKNRDQRQSLLKRLCLSLSMWQSRAYHLWSTGQSYKLSEAGKENTGMKIVVEGNFRMFWETNTFYGFFTF